MNVTGVAYLGNRTGRQHHSWQALTQAAREVSDGISLIENTFQKCFDAMQEG